MNYFSEKVSFIWSVADLLRVSWFSVKWRRGVLRQCRFRPCGAGIFKA
jgi:hypothetical protein